jgi:hypothetical protein
MDHFRVSGESPVLDDLAVRLARLTQQSARLAADTKALAQRLSQPTGRRKPGGQS